MEGGELAGELADYIELLTSEEFREIGRENGRVVLVQPGPSIINSESPALTEFATNHMNRLGVDCMPNTRVIWATPYEVVLSNGQRIFTKTIISAVETKPSPLIESIMVLKDEHGRMETDRYLRLKGYQNVWAGGDCAAVPHQDGGFRPLEGPDAIRARTYIAKNILSLIKGKEIRPYTFGRKSFRSISLGRRTAIAKVWGRESKGFIGWIIWRLMLLQHIPTWDRRLRVLADWCIWPLVGRDIIELSEKNEDDYEINNHLYLPGEMILRAGDKGTYIYFITEGEVELVDPQGKIIMTVGIGNYFGHINRKIPLTETVRAKTIVQCVSIKSNQAYKLKKILPALMNVPSE